MPAGLKPGQLGSACVEAKGTLCLRQIASVSRSAEHLPKSTNKLLRAAVFPQLFAR